MKVRKTEYYTEIKGKDENGDFSIQLQNDCSQIRVETEDGDVYLDIDHQKLRLIRDTITEVLDNKF